ncbi:phosphoglycerate mutase (2,3-diphosphoglycerate-independent) [Helicobacter didelphidarum]|uniref:2,3-bisphosphoglycerate-independent phosphoglycerate mutase n=1 Tax=Helicobacter didelphidarum TaxID=2040648 RepID=A0A3D8IDH7_9HELI|nr:2,3-bisphosphoglycerate-independent phosphoglycerate mutase [Helicobacter didelphidarum]RDU63202.1 phosphoglycerate mutase (2,3-diphosphoglycerate-independent) [Helicobacter didelphidarum]
MEDKVILIITDGIGYSEKKEYNAFYHAKKPHYDYLFEHIPHSFLRSYGKSVGLPDGQMGNSEVGHMCLGSGRILYQDLVKINNAINDGSIEINTAFTDLLQHTNILHLAILASDGGVHAHIDHAKKLAQIAKRQGKKVWLHLFSDGRDVTPKSFLTHYERLKDILDSDIRVATLCGRFYAMDRDKRWDRVQKAFEVITEGKNLQECSVEEYVAKSYQEGIYDEFILPASFSGYHGMPKANIQMQFRNTKNNSINFQNKDSQSEGFIFVNYRSDRAREIVSSLGLKDFNGFKRDMPNIMIVCMCEYDETFPFPIMFPKDKVNHTLAQIISENGLKQAHVAETEKYAHVTFFFNGGKEEVFLNEERLLIESPKVTTYDLKPEMSATEVADGVCDFIRKGFDFIVVNFANGDMVGHTGNFEASIKAVEAVDKELAKIWNLAKQNQYSIVMTSDHGNCEEMKDSNLNPLTNHTIGDVFCFIDSQNVKEIHDGALNNIAPTILKIMGLPIPKEMDQPLF